MGWYICAVFGQLLKRKQKALNARLKGWNSFWSKVEANGRKKNHKGLMIAKEGKSRAYQELGLFLDLAKIHFFLWKVTMMLLNRDRKARGDLVTFTEMPCDGSCFLGCLLPRWLCYVLIDTKVYQGEASVHLPALSRPSHIKLLRDMLCWVLNTCKNGDSTTALISVQVCTVKNPFSYNMESLRNTDFGPQHSPVVILNPYWIPQCQNSRKKFDK